MSERKTNLREYLQEKHDYVVSVLDRLNSDDWTATVYRPDHAATWTIHDVLAHLADSTRGQLRNARLISKGEDPIPPEFDLQRWNKRVVSKAAEANTGELADTIRNTFAAWIEFLDEVPEDALDNEGRHPGGQTESVEGYLRVYASHEANHIADLEKAFNEAAG